MCPEVVYVIVYFTLKNDCPITNITNSTFCLIIDSKEMPRVKKSKLFSLKYDRARLRCCVSIPLDLLCVHPTRFAVCPSHSICCVSIPLDLLSTRFAPHSICCVSIPLDLVTISGDSNLPTQINSQEVVCKNSDVN